MALLCRIRQSTHKNISYQFRRWYFQVPGGLSERNKPLVMRISSLVDQRRSPPDFCYSNVRFLSTQVKKINGQGVPNKEKEEESDEPRLNEKITAEFIRLVTDEEHFVLPKREALERARKMNLDLVEVQRNGKPPVCKIMDYNREKFAKQTKDKVRVKENKTKDTLKTGACKEIRFPVKAEQKDLQMKADAAKRLMEKGYRVKCTVVLDNKKKQSTPTGEEGDEFGGYILRVTNLIGEFSVIESVSKGEKSAYVVARHVKFGQLKKAKKVSTGGDIEKPELPEEDDHDLNRQNPTWTVNSDDGNLNDLFDVENEETVPKDTIQTRPPPHLPGQRTGANDIANPKLPLPSSGYGIFSGGPSSKINGDSPTEDNRYKKGNVSGSTRAGSIMSHNQGPSGSGGKWGIFSGEERTNQNGNRANNVQR